MSIVRNGFQNKNPIDILQCVGTLFLVVCRQKWQCQVVLKRKEELYPFIALRPQHVPLCAHLHIQMTTEYHLHTSDQLNLHSS